MPVLMFGHTKLTFPAQSNFLWQKMADLRHSSFNDRMSSQAALAEAIARLRDRQRNLDWASDHVGSHPERARFRQRAEDLRLVLDELDRRVQSRDDMIGR